MLCVLRLANTEFVQCFYPGSLPLLHTFICFVSVLCLANTGFVQCFYLRFPSPFAHVYLFCQCASPRKHRVCAVLLSSVPSPFAHVYLFCQCASPRKTPGLCSASIFSSLSLCTRLFVLSVSFASQTLGLCSASIFGSLPLLHTFICFVSVLRLANTGFVLRFPFAHICSCQCASPRKLRVCAVLFPPSLINLFAFMLCLYFTIDFVLRISPCKLRVCLGQSQVFIWLCCFLKFFFMLTFVQCYSLYAHFKFHRVCFSMYSLCVYRLPNLGLWSSVQFSVSKF